MIRDGHGGDQFGKIARYQTMLERTLVRALHELERRQATRRGALVAPPVAVDMTVSAPDVQGRWPVQAASGGRTAPQIEVRPVPKGPPRSSMPARSCETNPP